MISMKIKKLICGVLSISLLLGCVPSVSVEAKTTKTSITKEVRPKSSFIHYSKNEKLNKKLQVYIDKIPDEVLYAIQSVGYRIYLVKEPAKYFPEGGYKALAGLTDPADKKIYISKNKDYFRVAVAHEIGHAYDDYLGWISDSKEFKKVYKAEKKKFISTSGVENSYFRSDRSELFAEAFSMYIHDRKILKKKTPKTYKFIANLRKKGEDKEKESMIAQELLEKHPDDFEMLDKYSSSKEVVNYYLAMKYLPKSIYNILEYDGWKVVFIDDIDKRVSNANAIGCYNIQKKEVYIDSKKIQKRCKGRVNKTIQMTIVHELIHAFDYEGDWFSCMIYNPKPNKYPDNEVLAYTMTDWLFGKSVKNVYVKFIKGIIKDYQ